jgi:hemoglobin
MIMSEHRTVYERAGGDAPFRRLVNSFYEQVAHDPVLRPWYPEDLSDSREHLFLFLVQYFGGPARYHEQRGHPRLRMRHMPFRIGQAERDAWVRHMTAAIQEAGFPEDTHPILQEYFERAATFLINHAERQRDIELLG